MSGTRRKTVGRCAGVSVIVLALAIAGCQGGAPRPSNVPVQSVGAWQVGVVGSPDPARVGDNSITVFASDSSNRPLRGSVEVVVSMPAMGAMPYMESRAKVKPAGAGTFRATYGLLMGGEWDVAVRLHPDRGAPAEAHYRLSSSVRGLAYVGGTQAAGSPTSMGTAPPTFGDSSAGAVLVDPTRRQSLGIRTEPVQIRELSAALRVPGRVAYDEAHQTEVALKFSGSVRRLMANATGQPVQGGQTLLAVYSPELWAAQQEYIEAVRAAKSDEGKSSLAGSSAEIARAARERLALWDISSTDIDRIARTGHPIEAVPIRSPVSGVAVEKGIVEGSPFQAGQVLFRIAALDPIWVIASVPQQDAPFVRRGMAATIHDPYRGAAVRGGVVSFVYPSIDSVTRTAEVRVDVRNRDGRLQPGTFVDVELATQSLKRLAVPESAVLPTGERYVVFVDLGDGRLAPREVRLGLRAGGYYEVLAGLHAGDVVVTSGNFLVAAESKLRSTSRNW